MPSFIYMDGEKKLNFTERIWTLHCNSYSYSPEWFDIRLRPEWPNILWKFRVYAIINNKKKKKPKSETKKPLLP